MKLIVSLATAGLLVAPVAFAQSTPPAAQPPAAANAHAEQTSSAGQHGDLQQQMKQDLQKAGFTDVSVLPNSFLVQAKDRSGDPVAMIVGPNSMTALVAQPSSTATNADPATANADPAGSTAQGGMFTTVPPTDRLSSEVVGLDVYNKANQDIGTIKDIAYAGSSIKAYIVGVGGFLGVGDHDVAVTPSALHVSWDANAKAWHATMNTTADQLKAAPEFKYPT
jgi:hypothetical protein